MSENRKSNLKISYAKKDKNRTDGKNEISVRENEKTVQ